MRHCAAAILLVLSASPAGSDEFWSHWADDKAELDGYRLTQPRYGTPRKGTAVLVFVTEDFSDALRVKADPGKHPPSDVYPVLKLNLVRHFQTGIYDYKVMTSTFARVAPGFPLAKISFSAQEWCGNTYAQVLARGGRLTGVFHSYFDGEADGTIDLEDPKDGVTEDELPILLRGLIAPYLGPGESREVPFLRSLLRARLEHKPLVWGKAKIARAAEETTVSVPAGRFRVVTWTVTPDAGPSLTYEIEAAPPHRIVRWGAADGEEAVLLGSTRLSYWKLNREGDESYLKQLGLPLPK